MEFNRKSLESLPRRFTGLRSSIRPLLGGWSEWIGLLLLALTLGIVVRSIQQAQWINPQPSFLWVLSLSLVLGFILANSRLKTLPSAGLAVVAGFLVTFWQATSLLPTAAGSNIFSRIASSFSSLWQAFAHSSPNEGTIYFGVFLLVFIWAAGFFSVWRLLRRWSVWYAVFLGLAALLINLDYLNKTAYGYFYFFIFAAILLVCYVHFVRQRLLFRADPRRLFRRAVWSSAIVLLLGAILVGTSWAVPEIKANQLQSLADSKMQPGQALNDLKINVFAAVHAKGTIIKTEDQGTLYFSSKPNLSTDVQFVIKASSVPAAYWRVKRYDVYNAWGWTTSPFGDSLVEAGTDQNLASTAAARFLLTSTVTDKIKTDIVLAAGQFLSANSPVVVHNYANSTAGTPSAPSPGASTLPADQSVSITTAHLYKPDDTYTVTTVITQPTAEQLEAAGNSFPAVVTAQYLQLPVELPQPVRRAAATAVRRSSTEIDKVNSILHYLAQFTYDIQGSNPSPETDEVYSFLNIQKTGNCTNFATAAVVLMRASGVPARLATGYIPHSVDSSSGDYLVEARDYHAWPEVYFPGYGWIGFESTPPGSVTPDPSANLNPGGAPPNTDGYTNPLDLMPPYYPHRPLPEDPPTGLHGSPAASNNPLVPALLIAALVFIMATIAYQLLWRFKRRDFASDVFAKVSFAAGLIGIACSCEQTPLEFGARLAKVLPKYSQSINTVMDTFMAVRFSRKKLLYLDEQIALTRSWHAILRGILIRRLTTWH